jgi:hypothetical protein
VKNYKRYKRYLKNTLIAAALSGVMFFASCNEKNNDPKSSACDITFFSVGGKTWTVGIDGNITREPYPPETPESLLTPTIVVSKGATVNPPSEQEQNFFVENGVVYTVTAEDGVTKKTYTAKATRQSYSGCDILSFYVNNTEWTVIGDSLITYVYPKEMTEGLLTPVINLSQGATIDPPSGQEQNFFTAAGVKYTVTSDDKATTKTYTVRARRKYSDCSVLSFSTETATGEAVAWNIDEVNGHITREFPDGVLSPLMTPKVVLSPGATINPPASLQQDFVTPEEGFAYTVTAEDGETKKTYTVKAIANVMSSNPFGGCVWTLSGVPPNRTLTISVGDGNGAMPDYSEVTTRPPWEEYKDDIKTLVIEDGVINVGAYSFNTHVNITSVIIGDSVKTIGRNSFERCYAVSSVTIGNNVTQIGAGAFHMCQLTDVTIPSKVKTIGYFAFHYCPLRTVTNLNPTPQSLSGDSGAFIPFGNALDFNSVTLKVPAIAVNAYKAADVWKNFGSITATE